MQLRYISLSCGFSWRSQGPEGSLLQLYARNHDPKQCQSACICFQEQRIDLYLCYEISETICIYIHSSRKLDFLKMHEVEGRQIPSQSPPCRINTLFLLPSIEGG